MTAGRTMFIALVALVVWPARPADAHWPDIVEHWYGATNVNAAVGNGGLTAGIAASGEITVLRWPSPSYLDHLDYRTAATDPDSGDHAHDWPRMGAEPNEGIFAGLWVGLVDGDAVVTWFRDDQRSDPDRPWTHDQRYAHDRSNVLVSTATNVILGLQVRVHTWVRPDRDVLVQRFEVSRMPGSPVTTARLFLFENLAPCTTRLDGLPVTDWMTDDQNDFALLYSAAYESLVHFRPDDPDPASLPPDEPPPSADEADTLVAQLDGQFGAGVYVAIGADRGSDGHQCGRKRGPGGQPPGSIDALDDVGDDGILSGRVFASAPATGSLSWTLDFDSAGADGITVFTAFASEAATALGLVEESRSEGHVALVDAAETFWREWVDRAALPATDDEAILRVARRSLLTIRTAMDHQTCAVVDCITTQPPYAVDWPQVGPFVNRALDVAGFSELVDCHNRFYEQIQRREDEGQAPAGTWWMAYYADGRPGGPIFWEIDGTALAVWGLCDHGSFVQDEAERTAYLEAVFPAIQRGADALTACRDPDTGLQCPAHEWDQPDPTQSAWSAILVHLALVSAADMADVLGVDPERATTWRERADELAVAIEQHLLDAETGLVAEYPGSAAVLWPGILFADDDPRLAEQAQGVYDLEAPIYTLETTEPGAFMGAPGYFFVSLVGLARVWRDDPTRLGQVRQLVDIALTNIPTAGTDHYGDAWIIVDADGDGEPDHQPVVAIPNVWGHALAYLAAVEAHGLQAPDPPDPVVDAEDPDGGSSSDSDTTAAADEAGPPPGSGGGGGCSCQTQLPSAERRSPIPMLILVGAALLAAGRLRRPAKDRQ